MRQSSVDGGAAAPDAAAARPPPPPSPPAPSASMPRDALKRKIKLLVEEHGSNGDDKEARASAADTLQAGASPGQVYAQLLATLTEKHKSEAEYSERCSKLLEVLHEPLEARGLKEDDGVRYFVSSIAGELFDESMVAIDLVGAHVGSLIKSDKLSVDNFFQMLVEKDDGEEESILVDIDSALPFFMAALKAAEIDPASLKSINPTDLMPSYTKQDKKDKVLATFGR